MLVSRIIRPFITLTSISAFATASSGLQTKAISTKTLADFTKLLEQNRQQFTGELFGSVSRHLGALIASRERLNFDEAKQIVKSLEEIDVASLNERNSVNLLSVLRTFKTRGYQNASLTNMRNAFASRYLSLTRDRQATEQDLGDLVNAYSEFSFFKMSEGRVLSERLLKLLESGLEKGRTGLNDSQIGFLMYTLSCRFELSSTQVRIRSVLLKQVSKQLASFKMQDLVKVAVNLNRMDLFDFDSSEFSILRHITDRIFNSITELEERTIIELIRAENIGKMPGFSRIYEQISRNIFAEIDEKGHTELSADSVFRVFGHLSDKRSLYKASEVEKKKFFAFLEVNVRLCGDDENKAKQISFKIRQLVANNFFGGQQKRLLVNLLHNHAIRLNVNTLYDMAVRDYDITPLAKNILDFQPDKLHDEFLIKMSVVAYKLSKNANTPEATAFFETLQAKVAEQINTPEHFVEFYKKFSKFNIKFFDFHDTLAGTIQKLPNPFETTIQLPDYRKIYLQYMFDSLRTREFSQFFNKYESSIGGDELSELLSYHVRQDPRQMQYRRPLIQLLNKRIYDLIDSKNKKWIEAVIEFLSKYSRFAIGGFLDINSENSIFRMLHCLIGKLDDLIAIEVANYLYATLDKYLNKNHKSYNVENNYRQLVKHLVNYIERINTKKHRLTTTIVREALRLELLTKKSIENIPIEKLALTFFERSRALYVRDQTYSPHIEKVTQGSLEVILSNPNLENVLVENEKRIIEIIQGLSPQQLCHFLSIYNQNKHSASRRILAEILNNVLSKLNHLDRIDIFGIFQNALDRNFFHFTQYKRLTEKIVEVFKSKMEWFSIESHLQLIRFIISQPNFNPRDYYNELVAFAEKRDDISEGQFEQILLKLANTNYQFKDTDLKYVDRLIKRSPHTGIFLFLMTETFFDAEAKSKTVKDFVEKYNEIQQKKEQTFNRVFYRYLKKKYPQETANFNVEEKSLYSEGYLSKPKNQEMVNTIVKLAGGKYEELTDLGSENYLVKINELAFGFLYTKKLGAYHEHQFIKRAVSTIRGEELTTLCLYAGNNLATTLEYINKNCPQLFNQTEYQATLAELKSNSNRKKSEQVTEM